MFFFIHILINLTLISGSLNEKDPEEPDDDDEISGENKKILRQPAESKGTASGSTSRGTSKGRRSFDENITNFVLQYELQLPIHNENDEVDDFGYALVELDTEDVLVLLVEAPSGCTLDTFHLNDARSQLHLKFKKHPLSLNPRDVHKILVKNKVIPDEPCS